MLTDGNDKKLEDIDSFFQTFLIDFGGLYLQLLLDVFSVALGLKGEEEVENALHGFVFQVKQPAFETVVNRIA